MAQYGALTYDKKMLKLLSKMQLNICRKDEVAKLKTVMLCPPINFLMDSPDEVDFFGFREKMDYKKATDEFHSILNFFQSFGVKVILLTDLLNDDNFKLYQKMPNLIYLRDLAMVVNNNIFVGYNPNSVRESEFFLMEDLIRNHLSDNQKIFFYPEAGMPAEFGDIILVNSKTILVNVGNRTSIKYVEKIIPTWIDEGIEEILITKLPQQLQYAHLDLVCNILPNQKLICSKILDKILLKRVSKNGISFVAFKEHFETLGFEIIWIDGVQQYNLASNFLVLDKENILTLTNDLELKKMLKTSNIHSHYVQADELLKGGGGLRCLTFELEREENNRKGVNN